MWVLNEDGTQFGFCRGDIGPSPQGLHVSRNGSSPLASDLLLSSIDKGTTCPKGERPLKGYQKFLIP